MDVEYALAEYALLDISKGFYSNLLATLLPVSYCN